MAQQNEQLTDDETVTLKRQGSSQGFTVPAHWLKTIRELKREPLMFIAHVEKDPHGKILIIFEKIKPPSTEITRSNHK